jgi:S1-C subfamily serine protease
MDLSPLPHPPAPPAPRRTRRHRTATLGLVAGLIGGAIVFGVDHASLSPFSAGGSSSTGSGSSGASALTPAATGGGSSSSSGGSLNPTGSSGGAATPIAGSGAPTDLSTIAAKVAPALVDINSTFGDQGASGAGTGIVLTSNGEVITNNHVINGATSISVTDVGNGATYHARVIGYDSADDVAVLQLSGASGLRTASIGDSSTATVGESIVAVGNAGGTGGTPTAAGGSITGLQQSVTASDDITGAAEQLTGAIGVDADVQPGDSGGSLVNSSGQVLGIDTAGSSGSSGFADQSSGAQAFAIPINSAMSIAQQIEAGQGTAKIHVGGTGFLGVMVSSAGSQAGGGFSGGSDSSGNGSGVAISGVVGGSAAARAGLGADDVITSLDGQTVDGQSTLTGLLVPHHPGDKVQIGWTDASGQAHTGTVMLGSGPPA